MNERSFEKSRPVDRITLGVLVAFLFTTSTIVTVARLSGTRALDSLAPLRSINTYGLFARMTKTRPEIVVEGSLDGVEWRPYEFKWKPGRLDRAPAFIGPHMPRLDWQMWFAALGNCRRNPWFLMFLRALLQNRPEVTRLLADNPFPSGPAFIRSTLWQYRFADPAEHARGLWWQRQLVGPYCPTVQLSGDQLRALQ